MTIRARGVSPYRSTAAPLATTSAEAPSESGEEAPAVTMPSARKTVRSVASFSSVVEGRGPSSAVTSPSLTGTGTISRSKCPARWAATARWCERSAKASDCSRVIPSSAATSSAVSPMERVTGPSPGAGARSAAANLGLVNRHPSEVSKTSPGLAQGVPGFAITHGARVIDSTPPATTTPASPERTACAAEATAVRPEAQSRLTV